MTDCDSVLRALASEYGLVGVRLERILGGVSTVNYVADAGGGGCAFVKVYLPDSDLAAERSAIELSEFVAAGGVPTAAVVRSADGGVIYGDEQVAMSVWELVAADRAEDAGLSEAQLAAVGAVVGRMHRVLSSHPVSSPRRMVGPLCDVDAAVRKINRVLGVLATGTALDEGFAAWGTCWLRGGR